MKNRRRVPLYFQVEEVIKSKILTGELTPGMQIPTEKELAKTYQVSNITTRQAILDLVSQNLLYRIPGKGTFVTDEVNNLSTQPLEGTIDNLIVAGLKAKLVKVVDIRRIRASERISSRLKIGKREEVIQIRRIRTDGKLPLLYVISYLPLKIGKKIKKQDLLKAPLLRLITQKLGVFMTGGIQYIQSISADIEIASALSLSIGSPVLYLETIFFKKNIPVYYSLVFIRPERFKYTVKLTSEKW